MTFGLVLDLLEGCQLPPIDCKHIGTECITQVSPVQVQVGDAVTHGSGLHGAAPVVCVTSESTQQCEL